MMRNKYGVQKGFLRWCTSSQPSIEQLRGFLCCADRVLARFRLIT
jgi:hypothetical protein